MDGHSNKAGKDAMAQHRQLNRKVTDMDEGNEINLEVDSKHKVMHVEINDQ